MKIRTARSRKADNTQIDFKTAQDTLFVACGTADKVASQLVEWGEMVGSNHFNLLAALGNMPHWKVAKNLTLIAEEVIPRLRRTPKPTQHKFAR